jgi:hypothetical protein
VDMHINMRERERENMLCFKSYYQLSFFTCFCICNVKNIIRYLVTIKIVFYIMEFTKKIEFKMQFLCNHITTKHFINVFLLQINLNHNFY